MQYPNRYVFYSRTEDNPFLDRIYIDQLRRDLTPKEARRYLDGEWIEIQGEVIYSDYNSELQYRKDVKYEPHRAHPIILSWDFNIAENKPMSALAMQYVEDHFHVFDEVIIENSRTADTIDEFHAKGILNPDFNFVVCGDASGKHKDTRSLKSDYDIILKELRNLDLKIEYKVPLSNPAIRDRHNRVNRYCLNALGERRLTLYQGCKTLDEGLRLTKIKKGANYIEDDSKKYQHCTTALGYAIVFLSKSNDRKPQKTITF